MTEPLSLRGYQQEAVDAVYEHFRNYKSNPLIELPTGTGKSLVIAEFVRSALAEYPDTRIMVVTHVKELIEQNYKEMVRQWPECPAGIYSAGLGRRDIDAQVLFAGIQSIHNVGSALKTPDLVIVDEAHLIPRDSHTMYGQFLASCRLNNSSCKVIGTTATPFRLDSGPLIEPWKGKDALFGRIAYSYSIAQAIDDGYLCEVTTRSTEVELDLTGVRKRGGDYVEEDLQAAIDQDDITRAAVQEIMDRGAGRGSWLIFCSGVKHAYHVADEIMRYGIECATITGDTPKNERDHLIEAFRSGEIPALTNCNILTTGFNAPGIDLIAMLRPTLSCGLYVQMVGRGTRVVNGKDNCLVLDFAGNTIVHGPLDNLVIRKPGEGKGEAPCKVCDSCGVINHAARRKCVDCGAAFPEPRLHILSAAVNGVLLTSQEQELQSVEKVTYHHHRKISGPDSVRVEYTCNGSVYKEWICVEHGGYTRQKAEEWWGRRAPGVEVPDDAATAVKLARALPKPTEIAVQRKGQYHEVTAEKFI